MSLTSLQDAKEQVRASVDIVDLVGSYIGLRRQGRGYVGLCPWHDDSKPSLQVNPERQSFKCWVCDIGGDIFSFVMKAENLEFREALEMLAERAGIGLAPAAKTQASGDNPFDRRNLLKCMGWAEEQFHQCLLRHTGAEPARRYLAERGITDASAKAFHIGFAPNEWDWTIKRGAAASWSPAVLERVGLIGKGDRGYYDRFRGRLMFSIRDARARCIAFGGRVLPEFARDNDAKYVNSPETPLFNKSSELYALDMARDGIGKEKCVLVMEGYTDVIMAHQHGVTHAVAVLGTAFTEKHVKPIKNYTDTAVLVLDGDVAGQSRTKNIVEELLALFVSKKLDLKILSLPKGADPCDVIRSQGSEHFRRLLIEAIDPLQHTMNLVTNGLAPGASAHRADQAVDETLQILARSLPRVEATSEALARIEQVFPSLSRRFGLNEETLRTRLTAIRRGYQSTNRRVPPVPINSEDAVEHQKLLPWDQELVEIILYHGEMFGTLLEQITPHEDIESKQVQELYRLASDLFHGGELPHFKLLMSATDDPALKNLLVSCDEIGQDKSQSDARQRVRDLLADRDRRHTEARHRMTLAELKTNQLDPEQADRALVALFDDLKRRQAGTAPTDG